MKKRLLTCLALILLAAQASTLHARPKYIIVKKGMFGKWKFIQVLTPPRKLHKWYYDEKTDTYYRVRSMIGIGMKWDRIYIMT